MPGEGVRPVAASVAAPNMTRTKQVSKTRKEHERTVTAAGA